MKQYFMWLKLNQPKNQAQEHLQNFAKEWNNCLIDEERMDAFIYIMKREIERINDQFKRYGNINPPSKGHDRYIDESYISVFEAGIYFSFREIERYATTGLDFFPNKAHSSKLKTNT